MPPPVGPDVPCRPGACPGVIQGFFPGGRPRLPGLTAGGAAPPIAPARPAPAPAVRSNPVQPSSRPGLPLGRPQPIRPGAVRPGAVQPSTSGGALRPILPAAARPTAVPPPGGDAFPLPPGFRLRPSAHGRRLPEAVQRKMEGFFGTSFAEVRVHVGGEATSIGALAFTHGTDLYFAPGQYQPESPQGLRLLGHELAHVVQQRAGRVRNPGGRELAIVHDPALEAEAERMGLAAIRPAPIQPRSAGPGLVGPPGPVPGGPRPTGALQPRMSAPPAIRAILPPASLHPAAAPGRPGAILPMARGIPGRARGPGAPKVVQRMEGKGEDDDDGGLFGGFGNVFEEDDSKYATGTARTFGVGGETPPSPDPSAEVPDDGRPLKDRLLAAFRLNVSIEKLRAAIEAAPAQERMAAASDEALHEEAARELHPHYYPLFLVYLGARHVGLVRHTLATTADGLIRRRLGELVAAAVREGRRIEGNVVVVRGEAWVQIVRVHSKELPGGSQQDLLHTTNAFATRDKITNQERVYINADRGDAGTMIHEGVHRYAPDHFLHAFGEPMNEGVTEYFARLVTDELGLRRTAYPRQFALARALVVALGQQAVADAYFHGQVANLRDAFIRYRLRWTDGPPQAHRDWDAFLSYCKKPGKTEPDEDWEKGLALVEPSYDEVIAASERRRAREREAKQRSEERRARGRGLEADSSRPTGESALGWGGPGPDAVEPYGWGQNHPLYLGSRRDPPGVF